MARFHSNYLGPLTVSFSLFSWACGSDETTACRAASGCHPPQGADTDGSAPGGTPGAGGLMGGEMGGIGGAPAGGTSASGGQVNPGMAAAGAGGSTSAGNGPTAGGGKASTGGAMQIDAGAFTRPNGSPCDQASTCQSGICTSGLCCDSPCTDRFFSCNLDPNRGACTPMTSVYVDPLNGRDEATGTVSDPLKTLKEALSAAKSGWTVYLKPGTFSRMSGEDLYIVVPDGVAIRAVVEGNSVLVGGGPGSGLEFVGAGMVAGVTFRGFDQAIRASAGKVAIERCTIEGGAGVLLSGNVIATLNDVVLSQLDSSRSGLDARGSADVTVTGGSIGGIGYVPDCRGAVGVYAGGTSTVRLKDVRIHDLSGNGVLARDNAQLVVEGGTLTKTGQVDCGGAQAEALDSSLVSLKGTTLTNGNSYGLSIRDVAQLSLERASIGQHPSAGVYCDGGILRTNDSSIEAGDLGLALYSACTVALVHTTLSDNKRSIAMTYRATLKMRSSTIRNTSIGIDARSSDRVLIDLGTRDDPGANSFATSETAVALGFEYPNQTTMNAVGNKWNPNVQGADGNGQYSTRIISGPTDGQNFSLGNASIRLQL